VGSAQIFLQRQPTFLADRAVDLMAI